MQDMCVTDTCCRGLSDQPCEFLPDTNYFLIGLDNHTTCFVDNNIHNFVTKLTPTPKIRVRGVGNQRMAAKVGCTVLWKIDYKTTAE
jgi:hypothetical protein